MSNIISTTPNSTNPFCDSPVMLSNDNTLVQRVKSSSENVHPSNTNLEKVVISTVPTLCKTAELLAVAGQYVKAFHYFKEAVSAGSSKALYLLTGAKKCTIKKKPMPVNTHMNMSQTIILEKIKLFLTELQKSNPAYNAETVEKILSDLVLGHCKGFSVYYGQLSLEVEDNQDATDKYRYIAQKIVQWDGVLFEPPRGFNYRQYHAGDKQGLSTEEEKRMLLTDEIKQFFQMFRYAQQRFHEADEWVSESTLKKMNKGDIPLHSQRNIKGILGRNYKVPHKLIMSATHLSVLDHLAGSLFSNLQESNVALLSMPVTIGTRSFHAVTILFRENRYYLMDPNNTSAESEFDHRYHGIAFETPRKLLAYLASQYLGTLISGIYQLSYFEKAETKNHYLKSNPIVHETLIKLNKLYELLGDDLFNRAFPVHSDTFKLSAKIVKEISDRGALGLLSNLQIIEIDCTELDISVNDFSTYRGLIRNCPKATIIVTKSNREALSNALLSLGVDYENGNYSDLIIKNIAEAIFYYKEAANFGNSEAKYRLAQLYKSDDPLLQNHAEYIRLLLEITKVKEDPRVSYELGLAYMMGRYGLEIDLYKARAYFSDAQSIPLAKSFYTNVNNSILFREKNIEELLQAATQHGFSDNPTEKYFALIYLKSADSLGSKKASKLIAYMYMNKEVLVKSPDVIFAALLKIQDTDDGKRLLTKFQESGSLLMQGNHTK